MYFPDFNDTIDDPCQFIIAINSSCVRPELYSPIEIPAPPKVRNSISHNLHEGFSLSQYLIMECPDLNDKEAKQKGWVIKPVEYTCTYIP